MLMRQPFDLKFRFGVVGKTMYTIGGLLQKLKVNYFPTDKTTQIQRQVLEKWPNQSGVPEFILHDGVQHQGVCSETPSERGGWVPHAPRPACWLTEFETTTFYLFSCAWKGPKKSPPQVYIGKATAPHAGNTYGGLFWGPGKASFQPLSCLDPKMTKVMGKANARHKFLSTSFNPGRGQHFTVRKLYRQKKAPRRPSCPCSVDGHTVWGSSWANSGGTNATSSKPLGNDAHNLTAFFMWCSSLRTYRDWNRWVRSIAQTSCDYGCPRQDIRCPSRTCSHQQDQGHGLAYASFLATRPMLGEIGGWLLEVQRWMWPWGSFCLRGWAFREAFAKF